ncbi:MAG TPA: pyrimidine-nucleoside phosphorylase [Eubacteriaceae bacterium]|nr:pyrimidine-nucleoside phosphorylase [Eubacteriaceae bacterium]
MRIYDIILKKREGNILTKEEIEYFVEGYTQGIIPDYQASAFMMALYFQKMNREETVFLTKAMVNSGDILDLSSIKGRKVDKHSTGGVGDTTTLVVAPLVAAAGVPVAKMSGRGLGHTGGTIDKLESFRGFRAEISKEEFIRNVKTSKISIASQTGNLAPADKKLYALRDVTATVDNLSLIAASIMSKKLAAGADAIVLDVKTGRGAFMKNIKDSIDLARTMVEIGNGLGKETIAIISNMDQPLGRTVGNAMEVAEAINTLKGNGPADLFELSMAIATQMLILAKLVEGEREAREKLERVIKDGSALEKFRELIIAQGGDARAIKQPELLPQAKYIIDLKSPQDGFIKEIKADEVGLTALMLGAGRDRKDSKIDLEVGIYLCKKVGEEVKKGEVIAKIHSNNKGIENIISRLMNSFVFTNDKIYPPKLIYGIVRKDGIEYK